MSPEKISAIASLVEALAVPVMTLGALIAGHWITSKSSDAQFRRQEESARQQFLRQQEVDLKRLKLLKLEEIYEACVAMQQHWVEKVAWTAICLLKHQRYTEYPDRRDSHDRLCRLVFVYFRDELGLCFVDLSNARMHVFNRCHDALQEFREANPERREELNRLIDIAHDDLRKAAVQFRSDVEDLGQRLLEP